MAQARARAPRFPAGAHKQPHCGARAPLGVQAAEALCTTVPLQVLKYRITYCKVCDTQFSCSEKSTQPGVPALCQSPNKPVCSHHHSYGAARAAGITRSFGASRCRTSTAELPRLLHTEVHVCGGFLCKYSLREYTLRENTP